MNISSTSLSQTNQLYQTVQASDVTNCSSASASSSGNVSSSSQGSNDGASLSGPGQLFQELQSLSQSNPAEFKKITAEIAQELQTAAKSSTDSGQADFLNSMATNFSNASSSGKFSDLFPSQSQNSASSTSTGSSGRTGNTGSAAPPPLPRPYGGSSSNDSTDPLANIFSQALSQIQTDLTSTSSSISS